MIKYSKKSFFQELNESADLGEQDKVEIKNETETSHVKFEYVGIEANKDAGSESPKRSSNYHNRRSPRTSCPTLPKDKSDSDSETKVIFSSSPLKQINFPHVTIMMIQVPKCF